MSSQVKPALERVRYFPRQLMTAEDMRTEQDYFVERLRRHNRLLHGWGIICGLEVQADATADQPWRVKVCPGSACAATGDEIHLSRCVWFDLARPPDPTDGECIPCPCPDGSPVAGTVVAGPATYYLAIRYVCRSAKPVRTGHTNCGCGDDGCETSRWRDDFELRLLTKLEGPYAPEWTDDEVNWLKNIKESLLVATSIIGLPTRPCRSPSDYPWVILATIKDANLSAPPPDVGGAPTPQGNLAAFLPYAAGAQRRPLLRVEDLLKLLGMK